MQRLISAVILVLVLLVAAGIVVVGLQHARQSNARTECRNHLRLIALGLWNHHDSNEGFPSATLPNPDLPPEQRLSWQFGLEPYVRSRMDDSWPRSRKQAWDSPHNLAEGRWVPWYY
jgi:hypothetical protein